MRAYVVIICKIQSQNSLKMDFVQHDHVVQAFATDGTDDSLSVGILPGRSWRSRNFANLHAFHAVLEIVAEDAVAISKKKARRFFVGESVNDLLRSPFGIGIRRDVEVNDLSPIVPEYDENVEHSKGRRRHGKEVARKRSRTQQCRECGCEGTFAKSAKVVGECEPCTWPPCVRPLHVPREATRSRFVVHPISDSPVTSAGSTHGCREKRVAVPAFRFGTSNANTT